MVALEFLYWWDNHVEREEGELGRNLATYVLQILFLLVCLFVCYSLKGLMETPTLGAAPRLTRSSGSFTRLA